MTTRNNNNACFPSDYYTPGRATAVGSTLTFRTMPHVLFYSYLMYVLTDSDCIHQVIFMTCPINACVYDIQYCQVSWHSQWQPMGSQRYYRHFYNYVVELVDDDSLDGVIECLLWVLKHWAIFPYQKCTCKKKKNFFLGIVELITFLPKNEFKD